MNLAEDLADIALSVLLEHQGFENFWYDLEIENQEIIREELEEAIQQELTDEQ